MWCSVLSNVLRMLLKICSVWLEITSVGLVIEEEPSSLLIPVNQLATFSCRSSCNTCIGRWYVNGSITISNSGNPYPEYSNFIFIQTDDGSLVLKVNASEALNNTRVYCKFRGSGASTASAQSETATLLVISSESFVYGILTSYDNYAVCL